MAHPSIAIRPGTAASSAKLSLRSHAGPSNVVRRQPAAIKRSLSSGVRAQPNLSRHAGRSLGAVSGLAIGVSIATLYWSSPTQWQVLPVALAEEAPTPHAALDESQIHLDPDTKMPFPATLSTPATSSQLQLVGLGVRVVSFLRVQVYSVGTYFSPDALKQLKGRSTPDALAGEQVVSDLLDLPYDMAVRIVPVKNTDHGHLRDGFVRAMLARIKIATSAGTMNDEQAEAAAMAIETFKGFFPTGKVQRGKSMLLVRRGSDGALLLEFEGKLLGTLRNRFLANQLMLAYFADNGKEIAPKMKSDVLAGLKRFM